MCDYRRESHYQWSSDTGCLNEEHRTGEYKQVSVRTMIFILKAESEEKSLFNHSSLLLYYHRMNKILNKTCNLFLCCLLH